MCSPKKDAARTTIIREEVPFEEEILRVLYEHRDEIGNPVVRDFVCSYVDCLYTCANQPVERLPMAARRLQRVEAEDGGSYGYDPSDVSYWLSKLNQLFFTVIGTAYLRHVHQKNEETYQYLTLDLLRGLSAPLGFHVLCSYFQDAPHGEDQAWLTRACDLFGQELQDLETWWPQWTAISQSRIIPALFNTSVALDEPYYNPVYLAAFQNGTVAQLNIPYQRPSQRPHIEPLPRPSAIWPNRYSADEIWNKAYSEGAIRGYDRGHCDGFCQAWMRGGQPGYEHYYYPGFDIIIKTLEAERKRLVVFLKKLRLTLDVLDEDPMTFLRILRPRDDGWQVMAPTH